MALRSIRKPHWIIITLAVGVCTVDPTENTTNPRHYRYNCDGPSEVRLYDSATGELMQTLPVGDPGAGPGIGLILGVDRLLDMCRTVVNVGGDMVGSVVIGRSEEGVRESPPEPAAAGGGSPGGEQEQKDPPPEFHGPFLSPSESKT